MSSLLEEKKTIKSSFRRKLLTGIVALSAAMASTASIAGPAVAAPDDDQMSIQSGFTTSPVGTFQYSAGGTTYNVPTGCFLNMTVRGTGLQVDGTTAGVECVGIAAITPLFCNYTGQYRFRDPSGNEYSRSTFPVTTGCGQASYSIPPLGPTTVRAGDICLDFIVSGETRATACLAVFP